MRPTSYAGLAEHPHRDELKAALARIPALTDGELQTLASRWINTPTVAKARSRALRPETPLIVDILRVFDDVAQLFADDLDSAGAHIRLDAATVNMALKAVRDGLAGVIARPVLTQRASRVLEAPWRAATSGPGISVAATPTLEGFIATVRLLSHRCHDRDQADAFDRLVVGAMCRDDDAAAFALGTAFDAAVRTRRHRMWSLIRVTAERSLGSRCRSCPPAAGHDDHDRERVTRLCCDAACALLVADVVPAHTIDVLLEPLNGLAPLPRPPLGA